jgi:glycosyltransferase involved in cell wall biosynthesis
MNYSVRESPLVSVIIPVFNGEKFIEQSMKSVENQTYRFIELIVVNDGSTDATESKILDFISKSNLQVKLVTTVNQGASHAKNLGIRSSSGQLIAFLDADDLWLPYKVEKQVKLLLMNQDAIGVGCGYIKFLDDSSRRTKVLNFFWQQESISAWALLEGPGPGFNSTILLRRNLLDKLGGFDEMIGVMADDLDLVMRLYPLGKILQETNCLVELRVWNGQNYRNLPDMEKALLRLYMKHFQQNQHQLNLALSNLNVWIGIRLIFQGKVLDGLEKIVKGILKSPLRAGTMPWKFFVKSISGRWG